MPPQEMVKLATLFNIVEFLTFCHLGKMSKHLTSNISGTRRRNFAKFSGIVALGTPHVRFAGVTVSGSGLSGNEVTRSKFDPKYLKNGGRGRKPFSPFDAPPRGSLPNPPAEATIFLGVWGSDSPTQIFPQKKSRRQIPRFWRIRSRKATPQKPWKFGKILTIGLSFKWGLSFWGCGTFARSPTCGANLHNLINVFITTRKLRKVMKNAVGILLISTCGPQLWRFKKWPRAICLIAS